jgi:chemotaxis protein CheD
MTYSINGRKTREGIAHLYWDAESRCPAVPLTVSSQLATRSEVMVVATVGFGVALCVRDRRSGLAGMAHCNPVDGGAAAERLLDGFDEVGSRRDDLLVSLYGGAKLCGGPDRGAALIATIRSLLHGRRIPVQHLDLGGIHPRRVEYFTVDGRAVVHKIQLGIGPSRVG